MDAAELSPGEFSHRVRDCVDREKIRTVVIDSLNGYQASMPEEQYLILHLHELLQYLNRQGAATFLTVAQHGMIGDMKQTIDVTYLADTRDHAALFRGDGAGAARALGRQKANRLARGHHPRIPHRQQAWRSAQPLHEFQGVLRGVPTYVGGNYRRSEDAEHFSRRISSSYEPSERVLLLAPRGRDAVVAKEHFARRQRSMPTSASILASCEQEIDRGADVAVVTEEATRNGNIRGLADWVGAQPPWSDFPFML